MKRITGLYQQIYTQENLWSAYMKAKKGKRLRNDVAKFSLNVEYELNALRQELINENYRASEYNYFEIYERKPRLISVAKFRDRVLHHAIMNIVEPYIDKRMIHHSYACRQGKGVHKAIDYYQKQANRFAYVLKLDIRLYFQSIDHEILKSFITKIFKDKKLLALLNHIIDSAQHPRPSRFHFLGDDIFAPLERNHGIPIGNLTSQVFANLYLDQIDHWLQDNKKVGASFRYMDDITILADNKQDLWDVKNELNNNLSKIRLKLHTNKVELRPTRNKIDLLGYQVSRNKRWLRNDNGYRAVARFKKLSYDFSKYKINFSEINPRVQSWLGHAKHAQTYGLRKVIFNNLVFQRGSQS